MKIIEVTTNYNSCNINETCTVDFRITQQMDPPIFLFYEIDNFYQNHRRYVRSKSLKQLSGEDLTEDELTKNCDPITHVKDLKNKKNIKGDILDDEAAANPCGLIANSVFNG